MQRQARAERASLVLQGAHSGYAVLAVVLTRCVVAKFRATSRPQGKPSAGVELLANSCGIVILASNLSKHTHTHMAEAPEQLVAFGELSVPGRFQLHHFGNRRVASPLRIPIAGHQHRVSLPPGPKQTAQSDECAHQHH